MSTTRRALLFCPASRDTACSSALTYFSLRAASVGRPSRLSRSMVVRSCWISCCRRWICGRGGGRVKGGVGRAGRARIAAEV